MDCQATVFVRAMSSRALGPIMVSQPVPRVIALAAFVRRVGNARRKSDDKEADANRTHRDLSARARGHAKARQSGASRERERGAARVRGTRGGSVSGGAGGWGHVDQ